MTSIAIASFSVVTVESASAMTAMAPMPSSGPTAVTANVTRMSASTAGNAGLRGTCERSARTVMGCSAFCANRYIRPQVVMPPIAMPTPTSAPSVTE